MVRDSLRLYVLDCGAIHVSDTARYELRRDEVETSELLVACFLIIHSKGALIWDVGTVPDSEWQPTGSTIAHSRHSSLGKWSATRCLQRPQRAQELSPGPE